MSLFPWQSKLSTNKQLGQILKADKIISTMFPPAFETHSYRQNYLEKTLVLHTYIQREKERENANTAGLSSLTGKENKTNPVQYQILSPSRA